MPLLLWVKVVLLLLLLLLLLLRGRRSCTRGWLQQLRASACACRSLGMVNAAGAAHGSFCLPGLLLVGFLATSWLMPLLLQALLQQCRCRGSSVSRCLALPRCWVLCQRCSHCSQLPAFI
jgi:hypothetical protein